MTVTFPLTEKRDAEALLNHLTLYKLTYPGNCVVSLKAHVAQVSSSHTTALGTARTAW
ncbi:MULTISPECIES: hypothetical protein [Rhizobium]|uniref:Uncharacterized protein n=1 Tax=Rhizobium phaseoli TaxID=396 RepID=A0A192TBN4_9HYPH|nr:MULTISPECIES: hypothetical protein [Rhizobium]EGE59824.1 hypothetical protein RHECNPAF_184002 [Rhizobium etli CNPAF512]KEC73548.1 hypothetical protein RLPCCGM1_c1665 [Rhizobium leguminosarum bv. phaseoli CCGM1]ANL34782.1 hypothetical protein AMC89_CH02735 [Rhizobium phaseoli]ANL41065.1 hypothetical protein AMC88_CH02688 [Rhizobium phaseoli]ANL47300.1 hypothetical protein AMC87_CH02629 [Rhizobium phaseoli]